MLPRLRTLRSSDDVVVFGRDIYETKFSHSLADPPLAGRIPSTFHKRSLKEAEVRASFPNRKL